MRRLADVVDTAGLELIEAHVPGLVDHGVDPGAIRIGALPGWWATVLGLDVAAVTYGSLILLAPEVERLPTCSRLGLLAHEVVHVVQQRAGVTGFVCAYSATYLVGRLRGRGHVDAYRSIPAERLAREVQARVVAACRG